MQEIKKPKVVKKVEKKVETKESKEVDAYIHEGEDKPADPIPPTPNQKANPNYCVYKVKADGTPHPDACACKYVKNNNGDCVALTNDCFPAEKIPTNADCSAWVTNIIEYSNRVRKYYI